jgi:hypothetical protein
VVVIPMTNRARTFLAASLVAMPFLAGPGAALAHNGRDGAPPPLKSWSRGMAQAQAQAAESRKAPAEGQFIDIYEGIVVKVDPRTGVRSYTQIGDVPANPARARSTATSSGPGVDFWVGKEFEKNHSAPAEPSYAYQEPASQISSYDEGYYGGYLPAYGYGGGFEGRPGDGHGGGGRPGHGGGGGGGDNPPPRTSGIISQPYRPSPPPGPYGGGVGSPAPYDDRGVGAPPAELRYGGFRSRRG